MKSVILAILSGTLVMVPSITTALTQDGVFTTADQARAACGSDEVVWINFDRGRFYHKSQDNFGKGGNGGFACLRTARLRYREAHD